MLCIFVCVGFWVVVWLLFFWICVCCIWFFVWFCGFWDFWCCFGFCGLFVCCFVVWELFWGFVVGLGVLFVFLLIFFLFFFFSFIWIVVLVLRVLFLKDFLFIVWKCCILFWRIYKGDIWLLREKLLGMIMMLDVNCFGSLMGGWGVDGLLSWLMFMFGWERMVCMVCMLRECVVVCKGVKENEFLGFFVFVVRVFWILYVLNEV